MGTIASDQYPPQQFANGSLVHGMLFRTQHGTSRRNRIDILHATQIKDRIEFPLRRNFILRKVCSVPGTSWPVSLLSRRNVPAKVWAPVEARTMLLHWVEFHRWPNEHFAGHFCMQQASADITEVDAPVSCHCHAKQQSRCDKRRCRRKQIALFILAQHSETPAHYLAHSHLSGP